MGAAWRGGGAAALSRSPPGARARPRDGEGAAGSDPGTPRWWRGAGLEIKRRQQGGEGQGVYWEHSGLLPPPHAGADCQGHPQPCGPPPGCSHTPSGQKKVKKRGSSTTPPPPRCSQPPRRPWGAAAMRCETPPPPPAGGRTLQIEQIAEKKKKNKMTREMEAEKQEPASHLPGMSSRKQQALHAPPPGLLGEVK